MIKKYPGLAFGIGIFILCIYFLSVIFSDWGKMGGAQSSTPVQILSPVKKEIDVTVSATPLEINALDAKSETNLKTAEKVTLEIKYTNNTINPLSDFQIQILSGKNLKYKTGSTITAKFNKEETAKNKRATYKVAAAQPGQLAIASVHVYPLDPGVLDFRVLVTTREGPSAASPPVSINVK